MNTPLPNPFAPPTPSDSGPNAARARQRARWCARAAVALRGYAVAQLVTTVVLVGSGVWARYLQMASSTPDAIVLHPSVWPERIRLTVIALGDVVTIAANLLTVPGPRSRTRIPSVFGALVAMLGLASTIALPQITVDELVGALAMGLTRVGVLLFCLTALSIARDLEEGAEAAESRALWGVARWQLVTIVLCLIAAAVQGTAGASPLGIAIPAVGYLVAQVLLLFRGVPSLLRLARRAGG